MVNILPKHYLLKKKKISLNFFLILFFNKHTHMNKHIPMLILVFQDYMISK
jgi:hypothetical protein